MEFEAQVEALKQELNKIKRDKDEVTKKNILIFCNKINCIKKKILLRFTNNNI